MKKLLVPILLLILFAVIYPNSAHAYVEACKPDGCGQAAAKVASTWALVWIVYIIGGIVALVWAFRRPQPQPLQ